MISLVIRTSYTKGQKNGEELVGSSIENLVKYGKKVSSVLIMQRQDISISSQR